VVTVYDTGQADDGSPYIAMEYLEGEPLRAALRRRGAFPVGECTEILHQAARGLNAAHRLGIIHRDLEPENLFLTRSDEGELIVKVVDFGIAKLRESAPQTNPGMICGSPAYISFEQASGVSSEKLDHRSNIYSLGIAVYQMVTGRVPFEADTEIGYVLKHLREQPPPFRAVAPGLTVSAQVEAVVMKALAKDREARYGSALEFARAFAEAASAPGVPSLVEPRKPFAKAKGAGPVSLRGSAPSPGTVRVNPKDGLNYVWIPPGTFMMGCSPGNNKCRGDEKPSHQVTITGGFWIGQTPVTVGAYKRFAGTTGRRMPPAPDFNNRWANDNMPIVNVTWNDARAYCEWAGDRLPTEAEWEYAARGGSMQARYGPLHEIVWREPQDVAQKRPNGLGLYDMLGTVWQWVDDRYDPRFYRSRRSQDPQGPTSGWRRVTRGGFWGSFARTVRVSKRSWIPSWNLSWLLVWPLGWAVPLGRPNVGFRCAGEVENL
jgi:formylglycine-generating enzyme required for sulfatase activity